MKPDDLLKIWTEYRQRPVNQTIHPADQMFNSAAKPEHYTFVGEASAETLFSVLSTAPTAYVGKILDFGCGHGRVGRYLRAMFPYAKITYSDVDSGGVEFCATQFNGTPLVTPKDFAALELPDKYDLIWLGSVFTHIDYARMEVLFDKLFAALTRAGVLIGTFRGEKMYRGYDLNPEAKARDAALLQDYERTGTAYKRYPGWTDDWGLSLVKPQKIIELGQRNPDARLVAYTETGWAAAHDCVAWSNVSPRTIPR